ncbi:MAG: hypothetical protein POG24_09985, partial [Acidocella sp.]|nr:hypothetical protein [Acidocella sp.]
PVARRIIAIPSRRHGCATILWDQVIPSGVAVGSYRFDRSLFVLGEGGLLAKHKLSAVPVRLLATETSNRWKQRMPLALKP